EGTMVWQGRLVWPLSISQSQKIDVSIPIAVYTTSNYQVAEALRASAEQWPKAWRLSGMKKIDMSELSTLNSTHRPIVVSIHLISGIVSGNEQQNNIGGSKEDLYAKLCLSLGGTMISAVIFDEVGHGIVLLYNRNMRVLCGLVFQRSTIPEGLIQSSNQQRINSNNNSSNNSQQQQLQRPAYLQQGVVPTANKNSSNQVTAINPQAQSLLQSLSASLNPTSNSHHNQFHPDFNLHHFQQQQQQHQQQQQQSYNNFQQHHHPQHHQ
ncbi:expressed protein, partial [Phakopsora pachyrhizi]